MKKLFYSILHLGVDDSLSVLDSRRIKTINLLNLIVIFFLLIGFSNYFLVGPDYPFGINSIFFLLSLISLLLSKVKRHMLSFLVFTINVNSSVFYINQFYPAEAGPYLYYYPVIVSVVLLNNPSSFDRFALLHLLISTAFFVMGVFVSVPGWLVSGLSSEKIKIIWYYNVVISLLVTASLSILLSRLIYTQKKEIRFRNDDLYKTREEINQSLKEKEVLLAELHHRVKNNLAIISGLLKLQEDTTGNIETKQVLAESRSRIMSMALVHKMLFENPELKNINIGKYAEGLIREILNSYNLDEKVKIMLRAEDIILPVNKSIPLGLIVNEVVTNSIKYVFRSMRNNEGKLEVYIERKNEKILFSIKDNGPGFDKDFSKVGEDQSLGIYLIKTLAEQIDGEARFTSDNGARIDLTFNSY